jgi:hypothetical protein
MEELFAMNCRSIHVILACKRISSSNPTWAMPSAPQQGVSNRSTAILPLKSSLYRSKDIGLSTVFSIRTKVFLLKVRLP